MKGFGAFFIAAAFLLGPTSGTAQEPDRPPGLFPSGISFTGGMGRYSVRDEYISDQRYRGDLPTLRLDWIRSREDRGWSETQ